MSAAPRAIDVPRGGPAPLTLRRRGFLAGGTLAALGACAPLATPIAGAGPPPRALLTPLDFALSRLMRVTVCLRPFRPAGPRIELESFGDKTVLHNYGHGGSGWSLSWGCAEEARALVQATGARRVAVIGAGVIGMTTALRLVEMGLDVTIYAESFPAETRSARATGVWSPSSRIALEGAVEPGFEDRWKRWTLASYPVHQQMIGLTGDPVEYMPQYNLSGGSLPSSRATRDFAELHVPVRAPARGWGRIEGAANPFPDRSVRGGQAMVFNVAEYSDRLTRMFLLRGGRMVRRALPDRAAALALPEPLIVNCMGYDARAFWGDDTLEPVRGQINWLTPQRAARYALWHDQVQAVSRRDGLIVQFLGPNDDFGYGIDDETPDHDETRRALAIMQRVFAA